MIFLGGNDNFRDKFVCVMGLGYVGLPLAVLLADAGFNVFGVEIREDVLSRLKKGEPHFFELELKEELQSAIKAGRIFFSKNIPENEKISVFIITVGTPLDERKRVRLDMIKSVAKEISQRLKDNDLVILRSTVKVGTTRNLVLPILEKSGKKFDLAVCPERILEGQALKDLRELPQIIGGVTPTATIRAAQFFQFITPTVVKVSSPETAELIKLIDNASRDVSFAFSNEVARVCDALGISANETIKAGKCGYPRTNLPLPGPVGGPCLSKDSYILMESVKDFGIVPEITLSARKVNARQPKEVVNFLSRITKKFSGFPQNPIISLLGIAFKGKPSVDDLRGTMAKPVFEQLKVVFPGAKFRGFDPVISAEKIRDLGIEPVSSIEDAFKEASLVLILNNHPIFAQMDIERLSHLLARPSLIYDFWNNFTDRKLHLPDHLNIYYAALGSHNKINLN